MAIHQQEIWRLKQQHKPTTKKTNLEGWNVKEKQSKDNVQNHEKSFNGEWSTDLLHASPLAVLAELGRGDIRTDFHLTYSGLRQCST